MTLYLPATLPGCARAGIPEDAMTATICPWTTDCLPERPFDVGLTLFLLALVAALAINDYLGDDDQ